MRFLQIRALHGCACYQACDIFVHHIVGSHVTHLFIPLFLSDLPRPPTYLAYVDRILQLQHLLVEAHRKYVDVPTSVYIFIDIYIYIYALVRLPLQLFFPDEIHVMDEIL